eukprot:m.21375 g.21375  ORF g.21375 m.21375 type:complete len:184 (-) comp7129_c0_seq1:126-677(-)
MNELILNFVRLETYLKGFGVCLMFINSHAVDHKVECWLKAVASLLTIFSLCNPRWWIGLEIVSTILTLFLFLMYNNSDDDNSDYEPRKVHYYFSIFHLIWGGLIFICTCAVSNNMMDGLPSTRDNDSHKRRNHNKYQKDSKNSYHNNQRNNSMDFYDDEQNESEDDNNPLNEYTKNIRAQQLP